MSKVSENKKFWLAVFLCISGVALLFVGLFVNASIGLVLGGAGETFTLAGAILGIDAYCKTNINEIINDALKNREK